MIGVEPLVRKDPGELHAEHRHQANEAFGDGIGSLRAARV